MVATFIKKIGTILLLVGVMSTVLLPLPLQAVDVTESGTQGESNKILAENQGNDDFSTIVKNVISLFLLVLGIAAVFMIIYGGFRYVTSNGDSGKVESAKNTILYSVVGLIAAILAYAIVNFVLGLFAS